MSTLQGIGMLPDGTYINTTGDKDADTLYEIKRAEAAGEISSGEADRRISALAEEMAFDKYPVDPDAQYNEFRKYYVSFSDRSFDYYQVIDVTDYMNELMETETADAIRELTESGKINSKLRKEWWFLWRVRPGGKYDIKTWPLFQEHSLFLYDGEVASRDVFGNIFYGYLGSALGLDADTLHLRAGQVQKWQRRSDPAWEAYGGDDPRDWSRVQEGIMMFYQSH